MINSSDMEFDNSSSELTIEEVQKLEEIKKKRSQLKDEIESLRANLIEITQQIELLSVPEVEDPANKERQLAKKKFNMDPKKGLEFLFEKQMLNRTPLDVAKYFKDEPDLNKKAIGDYMGEITKEFNLKVLEEFTHLFDFREKDLMTAFREYLLGFHLPGESQKIDKIVTVFSEHYLEQNPGEFNTSNEVYVLSYAAIMLNTLMYNKNAKDKSGFSNERNFVDIMLNYENNIDLKESTIRSVYNNIRNEPFKTLVDPGDPLNSTYVNPVKEGWLSKLGGRVKSWKRRWFILNEQCLFYFVSPDRHVVKGIIPLDNIYVRKVQDKQKENCFELYSTDNQTIKACKTDTEGVVVAGKHSVYRMFANTPLERDEWVEAIRESILRTENANNPANEFFNPLR